MTQRGYEVCAFLKDAENAPNLLVLCDTLYDEALELRSEAWRLAVENTQLREQVEAAHRSKKVARRGAGVVGYR